MNVIEFRVAAPVAPAAFPHLDILIDDIDLTEHARRVELPFSADLAGTYAGLWNDVFWPSRHFLGEPKHRWFDDGDTVLLGCQCGQWECWPLTAQVEVTDETVTWSAFRNGHRATWDLSALGPFVFDRRQYETALRRTASAAPPNPDLGIGS